jgi:hypothetical protein
VSTIHFAARMAEIRKRFATKLAAKIAESESIFVDLTGESGAEALKTLYQRNHDMAGIAPTIGFSETGEAARTLDAILLGPYRAGRALTTGELARVRRALDALRAAAQADLKSIEAECLP